MKYFIYDVETTGLGNRDEVIQLGGFLADETLNLEKMINFYAYSQVHIDSKAAKVNGITPKMLWEKSKGLAFEDYVYDEMLDVLQLSDLTWVEYNNNGFDHRMINQTLRQNGFSGINFGKEVAIPRKESGIFTFNLLKGLQNFCFDGKVRKLSQAVATLPYSEARIDAMYQAACSKLGFNQQEAGFHDASYDAFVTWLLFYSYKKRFGVS